MSRLLEAEQLLADAAWLNRLARSLAANADDADDLVQESWIAAWQREPDAGRPLRPWLTKVIRDLARMRRRSDGRRAAREHVDLDDRGTTPPDVLLDQVRLHRLLVDLVLQLEEPYRSTIIARFVEGRTAASIAKAASISASTVRGQIRDGLARLRDQLDREKGDRKAWAPAVLAFGKGATVASASKATLLAVLALLLLLLAGSGALYVRAHAHVASSAETGVVSVRHAFSTPNSINAAKPWWDLAGVVRHPLAGRVSNRAGEPIVGARIEIFGWSAAVSGSAEATNITDALGSFRFAPPRDSTVYRLVVTAANYAGRSFTIDPRAPAHEPNPEQLTLILDVCAATIEGTVSDNSGGPIEGATIRVGTGPFGPSTGTTKTGHYSMCLAHEDTSVQVGADGYEHVAVPIDATGHQHVDVVLAPGGSIFGQVVDTETGDGVANAQVFVAGPGAASRHALSDSEGRFELQDVASGRLGINAWMSDHDFPGITDVEVVAAKRIGPIILKVRPATTIRGLVRAGGVPLVGAVIRFEVQTAFGSTTSLRAISGTDGRFVAPGVGRAKNVGVLIDGATVEAPMVIDTRTIAGDITIDVHPSPAIRGHVTRRGAPVPSAIVRLLGSTSVAVFSPTQVATDSAGRFEFSAPEVGAYSLYAECKELGAFTTAPTKFSVPVADSADIALELDGGGRISGTVVDKKGTPLGGLSVKAVRISGDDIGKATTAIDGSFAIDQLAGTGDYKVTVSGYANAPQPLAWAGDEPPLVTLRNGDAEVRGLRLAVAFSATTIEGTVVDDVDAPVADAIVRAGPSATDIVQGTAWPRTRTDADGRFSLRISTEGPFRLQASLGGRPRASIDNVASGTTNAILRLSRVGSIHGTLVNLDQAVVRVRALVSASNAFAPGTYAALTDNDSFQIVDLTPGDYSISAVSVNGRSAANSVTVRAGETATVALSAEATRTLRASVYLFGSNAPVAGVRCVALASSGDVITPMMGSPKSAQAITDAAGQVTFDAAPAENTIIECDDSNMTSSGATRVTDANPRVAVVRSSLDGARPGSTGIMFDRLRLTPVIAGVLPMSSAAIAGVATGDVIEAVDGTPVAPLTSDAVMVLMGNRPSGSNVNISVRRGAARLERTLRVGPHG